MPYNNRFTGMTYNADGSLKNDGVGDAYTYNDADGRLTASGGITYTYDGDGMRVKKSGGTAYWRGASGDPLVESPLTGKTFTEEYVFFNGKRIARRDVSTGDVYYYFSDHLGSADTVTSASGTIEEQSDYYPFGGEVVVFGSDPNTYKFTGKQRDTETGNDYFGARYYSSSFGRFLTVDKIITTPARLSDPQRLNLYDYSRSNPLSYIDVNGEDIDLVNDTDAGRKATLADLTKGMTSTEAANIGVRQYKNGNWVTFVKDKGAVSMKDASVEYQGVVGVINDHSVTVNVGLVGEG